MTQPSAPPARSRALIVMCHDYPPLTGGGLAGSVNDLSELLAEDFEVVVITARLFDHFADDRDKMKDRARPLSVAKTWRLLRRADGLIVHWTFSFRWLSSLAALVGPVLVQPTILVIHTAPQHMRYNRIRRLPVLTTPLLLRLSAMTAARCNAVVALSSSHANALLGAGMYPTHKIPLPVRTSGVQSTPCRMHLQSTELDVVGFAGELSVLKGADALTALMSACAPEFAFRITGRGPLDAQIRRDVESLSATRQSRISLTDRVAPARMPEFFAQTDAVLILSRTESQCRVAIEAMLAGVIVLTRHVEGVSDLVDDGKTGFFILPEDPKSVLELLRTLRARPEQLRDVRTRALERARNIVAESERIWPRLVTELIVEHRS